MGERKIKLFSGGIFHIYARSIGEFKIFISSSDFLRMKELLWYHKRERNVSYSDFLKLKPDIQKKVIKETASQYVDILAYCLMPTHIHLILHQIKENGISKYMEKVLKSYSLYFNKKNKRKGPLWAGRFSNVLVESDEQLLHLTRYIHLNPVSAYLIEKPEDWQFSSYKEYVGEEKEKLCNWENFIEIKQEWYIKFVKERKDYQREIQKIKRLLLEEI